MVSRSLTAFFVTVQFLWGLDFGFFTVLGRRAKRLATCVSFTMATLISSTTLLLISGLNISIIHSMEYLLIFTTLKTSKFPLYQFLHELHAIDNKWQIMLSIKNIGRLIWFYTFTAFILKWTVSIIFCIIFIPYDAEEIAKFILPLIPLTIDDVVPVVNFLIFYNVYVHFKDLRIGLEQRSYEIEKVQSIFREVADCLDNLLVKHDNLLLMAFIFESWKWMSCVYSFFFFVKINSWWLIILLASVYPVHHTLQLILPAVVAEMIGVEIDAIKIILNDRLLLGNGDAVERQRTLRLLRYLQARRLPRLAWRLVPVDLKLPVAVLSMSATYVIVIMQFSHLFP